MVGRVVAFLAFLAAATASALDVVPGNPVPLYTLVHVKLDQGERAFILASDFSPVEVANTSDGLVFVGPPGRYAVMAFTADSQAQRVVEIGDAPGPPPDPDPGPDPPDPAPDTIESQIHEMVLKHVPAASQSKSAALGAVYKSVADRIGNDLWTPAEIRKATSDASTTALSGHVDAWMPFFESLAKRLYKWATDEQRDRDQYKKMWLGISKGLSA